MMHFIKFTICKCIHKLTHKLTHSVDFPTNEMQALCNARWAFILFLLCLHNNIIGVCNRCHGKQIWYVKIAGKLIIFIFREMEKCKFQFTINWLGLKHEIFDSKRWAEVIVFQESDRKKICDIIYYLLHKKNATHKKRENIWFFVYYLTFFGALK